MNEDEELRDELIRINNDQTNILRATVKELSVVEKRAQKRDDSVIEELTQLNNEMANLQRELARRNAELQRYRDAAEDEQRVAHHLMSRLVRIDMLRDPLLECWIQPAHNLSGDLITAARTPGGVLHVLLADGTGHGLPAALNVLPLVDPFYAMTEQGCGIAEIAREVNAKIYRWLPVGRFVAGALMAFDPARRQLEVWCGGIPAPFLVDRAGRLRFEFGAMHLPLGVASEERFDGSTQTLEVVERAQLVVCSDGTTEAIGRDGTPFGRERLLETLSVAPSSGRLDRLKAALAEHLDGRPASDDISVALIDCVVSPPPFG